MDDHPNPIVPGPFCHFNIVEVAQPKPLQPKAPLAVASEAKKAAAVAKKKKRQKRTVS